MTNYQNHTQQRRYAFGKFAQPGYGNYRAFSTVTPTLDEFVLKDKALASAKVKTYDNKDQSTGVDFAATEQWIDSHDVTVDHTFDTSFEQLGKVLLMAFGGYSVTGTVAPFVHTFTPQDATGSAGRQLPSYVYVEQTNGGGAGSASAPGVDRIFPDMVCNKFSMKGESVAKTEGSFSLQGSGRYITPSAAVFPPQASPSVNPMINLNYPFNSQAQLTISDYSTLSNPTNFGPTLRLNNWSFSYENSLISDEGYRPGSLRFQTITTPGVAQVETITVAVTSVTSGTGTVTVTAAGMSNSPKAVNFTTVGSETAAAVAALIRTALAADPDVGAFFSISGATTAVILTARKAAADDGTMTAVVTAANGVSAATSANTTAGALEVSDPTSGSVRSELLFNSRMITFEATVRVGVESQEAAYLRSQRALDLNLVLTGATLGAGNYKFRLHFNLAHYEAVDLGESNNLITMGLKVKILADAATAGFPTVQATLSNNTATYITP